MITGSFKRGRKHIKGGHRVAREAKKRERDFERREVKLHPQPAWRGWGSLSRYEPALLRQAGIALAKALP